MISVVMPVYNGEAYVKEAVESVLHQTHVDFEFIIINDASTDSTAEIIDSFHDDRIKCLTNSENLGVARSLNLGLDRSQGEYIIRLDADDYCTNTRLEVQKSYMDAHPNVDVCGAASESFSDTVGKLFEGHPSTDPDVLALDMFFSCGLCHPTVILRTATLKNRGFRYDPNYNGVEDYELWLRMMRDGCLITNQCEMVLFHRIHDGQVTNLMRPEILRKLTNLHTRHFEELGISFSSDEILSFVKFVANQEMCEEDYRNVTKIVVAANNCGYYERKKSRRYFQSVLFNISKKMGLSKIDRIRFLTNTGLFDHIHAAISLVR